VNSRMKNVMPWIREDNDAIVQARNRHRGLQRQSHFHIDSLWRIQFKHWLLWETNNVDEYESEGNDIKIQDLYSIIQGN
jgi:hypothetical protein